MRRRVGARVGYGAGFVAVEVIGSHMKGFDVRSIALELRWGFKSGHWFEKSF